MKSWQIDFEATDCETLSWELLNAGANAVNEESENKISAFISGNDKDLEKFLSELQNHITITYTLGKISQLEDKNWIQNCPELLEVIKIGKLTIYPIRDSSEAHQIEPSKNFFIIPDQAFGTGHHPTTRMCIELLQSQVLENDSPHKILDFGCGSGILSIIVSTIFHAECLAYDIDDNAIANTKQNISLNYFATKVTTTKDWQEVKNQKYDLIMANIYSSILCGYEESFLELLNYRGMLIISGVLEEQYEDLITHYSTRWREVSKLTANNWVAALLTKK
ncbi:MAG: 50S ribosomal protein L11 methyltransferase [Proteobacteria bacterium]|nr:50S ribosomal protein L11 methyltransferase [Pseudomonadota bacterium]